MQKVSIMFAKITQICIMPVALQHMKENGSQHCIQEKQDV